MAKKTNQQVIDDLESAMRAYVERITDPFHHAQANAALSLYLDAYAAFANVSASAAASYSTGIGLSAQKRQVGEARAAMNTAFEDFRQACLRGGVTVPTGKTSVGLWSVE